MKIVRFENGTFGLRKWCWKSWKWMFHHHCNHTWYYLKDVEFDRHMIEMTYKEANEWFDAIENEAKSKLPNRDRGTVVSRLKDQERISKGPSC